MFKRVCLVHWPGFAASMASIPLNSSSAQMLRLFGVKMLLGVNKKQKKQPNNLEKKHTLGPILQKKDIPAQPEAPLMKDQSLLMPQTRQFTGQRQIWTDSHHANKQQHHISAPDAKSCTSLHVRGQKTRLFLPKMMNTWA